MPNPIFAAPPLYGAGAGISTEYGTLLPPGSRPIYVCSAGSSYGGSNDQLARQALPTLAAGLAQCRSGLFDTVVVLPGHTENVTDATMFTNLVAGTQIIGMGSPFRDNAPTFTWTATGSQWPITVKNVTIRGLRLLIDGANGVVKGIISTAAGTSFEDNYISVAAGAALKATIAIEVGSAAHDFSFIRNYVTGTETHNVTDGLKVVGATPPARLRVVGNTMIASATAANGLVHVTVAALRGNISYNNIFNTHTASTACIAVDAVAASGLIAYNNVATVNDGVATAQGIIIGAGGLYRCFQNFSSDEPAKSGVLTPGAVAT